MHTTQIDVSLDKDSSEISFELDHKPLVGMAIVVPFNEHSHHLIELNRKADETWTFDNIVLWRSGHSQSMIRVPVGAAPPPRQIFKVRDVELEVINASDDQIALQNLNRNQSGFNISIHVEITIELDGIFYVSKDPQVIDEKDEPPPVYK